MAIFPGAIAADSDLYVAVNQKNTTLTSGINNSTLTIPVVSTTGFPSSGFITIDSEIIHYTSVGASQFNADLRGADSTSAASHSNGAFVYHNIVSAHHNSLKDEIKAVEQFISDLVGRTNTQVKAPDGSNTAPAFSYASETGLGFYRNGSHDERHRVNGVDSLILKDTGTAIHGTTTNDSAATGFVGELITSVHSTNTSITSSGVAENITSITLTAGDWEIYAVFQGDQPANLTLEEIGISTDSTSAWADNVRGNNACFVPVGAITNGGCGGFIRVPAQLSSTTTYYFKISATYTGTAPHYRGTLTGRRVR